MTSDIDRARELWEIDKAELHKEIEENTICRCRTLCTEETCPCMNVPCGDDEKICDCPRGCLSDCMCVRRPSEYIGECTV